MGVSVSKVQSINLISECRKRLNIIGKITLENVGKTDTETCDFLRKNSPARLKELARMNCYAAEKIKSELDKKYGENNYVMIALGRSLSSIAELMRYLGADTKIIPLSGLRKSDIDSIPSDSLQVYKTYLVQIGLSKTDLEKNKDKTYVLTDYTHFGRSLEKAEKLLKKNELLGDAKNLVAVPVSDILGEDYKGMGFEHLFSCSRFKNFSYVGKLHVEALNKVFEICSPDRINELKANITEGVRKLFWFNVFDLLKQDNKIIPKREIDAIFKHYYSGQALLNGIKKEQKTVDEIVQKNV